MIFEVILAWKNGISCMEILWTIMMWHNKSTLPSSWACAFGPRIWQEKEKIWAFAPKPNISVSLGVYWPYKIKL